MSKRTPVATQEHDTSVDAPAIPEPGQGKRGEGDYLGYLLRQANAAQRLRMKHAVADVDVAPPQFLVFTILHAYLGISNADLTRLAILTPQTVSAIVINLECNGAITHQPYTVYGRIQHIDVIPDGPALPAACREHSGSIERDLLEGFSPKEEEAVRR